MEATRPWVDWLWLLDCDTGGRRESGSPWRPVSTSCRFPSNNNTEENLMLSEVERCIWLQSKMYEIDSVHSATKETWGNFLIWCGMRSHMLQMGRIQALEQAHSTSASGGMDGWNSAQGEHASDSRPHGLRQGSQDARQARWIFAFEGFIGESSVRIRSHSF